MYIFTKPCVVYRMPKVETLEDMETRDVGDVVCYIMVFINSGLSHEHTRGVHCILGGVLPQCE